MAADQPSAKPAAEIIPIRDLLGPKLLVKRNGKATEVGPSELDGKYLGLYFSAHWCPPCRAFTPQLKQIYQQLTAAGKPFEIIFVSSDRSQSRFDEYYSEMPWAALPYSSAQVRSALASNFNVMGIPTLAIVAPDGSVMSRNARDAVLRNPEGFPWEGEGPASSSGFNMNLIMAIVLIAWAAYRLFFSK